ncbi:ABC-2 transporter permease [Eubacteriales bacterium OttesenSCG-928-K08]|nr:ABC-2 transporter permease [Eubacteriales bacterium OttesenSCG-928-K08]
MKGLLLKDFYMTIKYCRAYIFIIVVFLLLSFFGDGMTPFMFFYPAILAGMVPVALIAYEERCKWTVYSETFPLSRTQAVSCKYFVSLIGIGFVIVLSGIVQAIRVFRGVMEMAEYAKLMFSLIAVTLVVPSLVLPLIFKLGSEKGRIAYFIVVGVTCAVTVMTTFEGTFSLPDVAMPIVVVVSVVVFALSWLLSIKFYKAREL